MNNKADLLKKTELKKVKPFPKFVISLLLLLVVVGLGYFLCLQPSTHQLTQRYESLGQFICKYDIALICFILVMNVIELIDFAINAKRDEAINANYEAMLGHIHLLGFFKQYFAPLFAKGPFIFASEEKKVAAPRKIIHLVVGTIKWLYWLVFILLFIAMMSKPEFKTVILEGNRDYIFTAFVLFLCTNCNIVLYAFYKISPLYSSRTYEIVTYYTDGTTKRETKSQSNFVAMLLLSIAIYLFFSVFYFLSFATKINRTIETNRFSRFLKKSRENQSILNFYIEK